MAGHHGSPPRHRPEHGHGHGHGHGHDDHGHGGHGHGHGHGGHGGPDRKHGHGDCEPKSSDGGSIPITDPEPVEPSGPYPEVVGLTADQATKIIQQKLPGAVVDVIPAGDTRPTNATVPNTVRLWLDHSGIVQIVEIAPVDSTTGGGTTDGGNAVPIDDNPTSADGPYPEVIGLDPNAASAIVKQKAPDATVDIIPGGETRPTLATVPNTVRLWLDHGGKVQLVELPAVSAT